MKPRTLCMALCLWALGCAQLAALQSPDPARFAEPALRAFSLREGLPQSSVHAIARDKQGYVWAGTEEGAAYFTGQAWVTVNLPTREVSNWVRSIFCAEDGSLWFGTSGAGIVQRRAGAWRTFGRTEGLPGHRVLSIAETREADSRTTIWAGTDRGLARYRDGRWEAVVLPAPLDHSEITCLHAQGGELWVGTPEGLAHRSGSAWKLFGEEAGLPSRQVWCIYRSEGGTLWAGTARGVAQFTGERWVVSGKMEPFLRAGVRALAETRSPRGEVELWAALGKKGLARFRDGHWEAAPAHSSLAKPFFVTLLAGRAPAGCHALWLGSRGAGAIRMDLGQWYSCSKPQGLSNPVMCFAEAPDQSMYVGTWGGGLWHIAHHGNLERVPAPSVDVMSMLATPEGLLCSGLDGKLLRMAWGTRRFEMVLDRTPSIFYALAQTASPLGGRTLWAGTVADGLHYQEKGIWSRLGQEDGLPGRQIRAMAVDGTGSEPVLFVATDYGLARVHRIAGRWRAEVWGPKELHGGLVNGVRVIPRNGQPELWVACQGRGLYRLDPRHPEHCAFHLHEGSDPALPNNTIYRFEEDPQGRIYLSTNRGVARLALKPGRATGAAPTDYRVTVFTTADGLPVQETNSGASFTDHLGRIWIGTVEGLAVLDPSMEAPPYPAPLVIERALANGRAGLDLSRLRHDQNRISLNFHLLNEQREQETRYRTQLLGLEKEPGEWSAEGSKEYAALPPGRYTLQVWAMDHTGAVHGPAQLAIAISPKPWQTWWAWVLYSMAALALFAILFQVRVKLLAQRNRWLKNRIAEATRDLREQELAVEAQARELERTNAQLRQANELKNQLMGVVAHDLRNPLEAIVLSAELVKQEEDAAKRERFLDRILDTSRSMADLLTRFLDINRIESGQLKPELQDLDLRDFVLEHAERFTVKAMAKGQELCLKTPDPVPVLADPKFLAEVLNNLLSNAVKYSPKGKTIRVEVRGAKDCARITVADEGPGLSTEDRKKLFGRFAILSARPTGGEQSVGLGLSIVKHMVDAMGGRVWADSEPGRGSAFHVELPVPCLETTAPGTGA